MTYLDPVSFLSNNLRQKDYRYLHLLSKRQKMEPADDSKFSAHNTVEIRGQLEILHHGQIN